MGLHNLTQRKPNLLFPFKFTLSHGLRSVGRVSASRSHLQGCFVSANLNRNMCDILEQDPVSAACGPNRKLVRADRGRSARDERIILKV